MNNNVIKAIILSLFFAGPASANLIYIAKTSTFQYTFIKVMITIYIYELECTVKLENSTLNPEIVDLFSFFTCFIL